MVDIVRALLGLDEVKDEPKPKKKVKKKAKKKSVPTPNPPTKSHREIRRPEAEEVEPDDLDAE